MAKKYSPTFKEEACRLARQEGYNPASAAKSLGIPEATLVYWLRRRRLADQPLPAGGMPVGGDAAGADPRAQAIQIRELQAKVRRLEMEKEILKKATAFFASQQP